MLSFCYLYLRDAMLVRVYATAFPSVCHMRALYQNGARYGHSCYRSQIGNHAQTIEWWHFR